jgi:hypothetical protein
VRVRDGRVIIGPCGDCCKKPLTAILLESLGQQDDDIRLTLLRADGQRVTLSDTRCNASWYKGEQILGWTGSFLPTTLPEYWRSVRLRGSALAGATSGDRIEVHLFDGWGGSWIMSPWRITATYSDGTTRIIHGGRSASGTSVEPLPPPFTIDLGATFPPKVGGPAEYYGAVTFGPYPFTAEIWSRSTNPAGANDDLAINGTLIFPDNDSNEINGGADTLLATVAGGSTWTVDVRNRAGYTDDMGGFGSLSIEPTAIYRGGDYYSTGPHILNYYEIGFADL